MRQADGHGFAKANTPSALEPLDQATSWPLCASKTFGSTPKKGRQQDPGFIGVTPGIFDKGHIECPKSSDEGYVRDDLVAISENTKVIDDGFLHVLVHISEAAFAVQIFLLHRRLVLVRRHEWIASRERHHVVLVGNELERTRTISQIILLYSFGRLNAEDFLSIRLHALTACCLFVGLVVNFNRLIQLKSVVPIEALSLLVLLSIF